jgi:hypothetical protein
MSIELLIEFARSNPHRQFIFISPHDPSVITKGTDVKIMKMKAPERNQSTLSFSQTLE